MSDQAVPQLPTSPRWIRIGSIEGYYEYPQHAGLSTDGRHFMLVEYSEIDYLVVEIRTQKTVWHSDWMSGQYTAPKLAEWIKDGFVEIAEGPAAGRYRIFGTRAGAPLLISPTMNLSLALDTDYDQLILRDATTLQKRQRLKYLPSDDWTFASFSDDGSVIAVFANHAVTFFAPAPQDSPRKRAE